MITGPKQLAIQAETHRNHYLFSDYYLDHRLYEQPEWQTVEVGPLLAQLADLWGRFVPQSNNEAQTEADWIRPILAALGHTYNVQTPLQTPFGMRRPDYILYPDETARQAARTVTGPLTAQDLQGSALAVADAKAWERDLDRTGAAKKSSGASENPSLQIYVYIQYSGLACSKITPTAFWPATGWATSTSARLSTCWPAS